MKYLLFTFCAVLSFVNLTANADPLVEVEDGLLNANSGQVLTVNYRPLSYASGDNSFLKITINASNQVCLYPVFLGGGCSGTPVCTSADDTWTTSHQMEEGDNFTVGLTLSGLDALANSVSSPSSYHCLRVKFAYASSNTSAKLRSLDRAGDYTCQIASSGGSFIGGDDTGNPCSSNQTQLLVKEA